LEVFFGPLHNDIDVSEAGYNPQKHKNNKKIRVLGFEPLIEIKPDKNAYDYSQGHGDTHGADDSQQLDVFFGLSLHKNASGFFAKGRPFNSSIFLKNWVV
jgi:hypothetical protein